MSDDDDQAVYEEFGDAVNMTAKEIDDWLDTDESKGDLSADDYAHMRKVNGYVKRHLAQRPSGDVGDSDWRYSLMNWGHDPTK